MISIHDVRKKYLDFFQQRGHVVVPSASLIPENDPTTLFTGSGMQPMISFLLGEKHPAGTRITDSQKCFRTEDIGEVGDNRHTTFFEMLGNWSLGDYFKKEQIPWIFEFITQKLGLEPQRLYVSVFRGNLEYGIPKDEEAASIWKEAFAEAGIDAREAEDGEKEGMQSGKIFYYPDTKNWWSRTGVPANMPFGEPGGPDSEIFWDFGEALKLHENSLWKAYPCHVSCDCGRFMEIGNSVFMSYVRTKDGFVELPKKNIDFGGGLERMTAAVNDDPDIFLIDIFEPMRELLEKMSGKQYGQNPQDSRAFRVIMDHVRAATFLIADGALPSNKDQGYFTRRLIRRSIRFAHQLGISDNFCADLIAKIAKGYQRIYPSLFEKVSLMQQEVLREEEKFRKTLGSGLKQFERSVAGLPSGSRLSGEQVFDLYQTYGFPIEITEELAQERGMSIDTTTYQNLFDQHQELSRKGAVQKFRGGLADTSEQVIKYHTATHLLHAALRSVLGEHAIQKGSNITSQRLRFDFSHPDKLTSEQIRKVEELVNQAIERDYPVTSLEMSYEEAKNKGAIGLFGERYGDTVKVYTIGDPDKSPVADRSSPTFSREICGGPHVTHTKEIGKFKIIKEEAVAAGIRRIKAVIE